MKEVTINIHAWYIMGYMCGIQWWVKVIYALRALTDYWGRHSTSKTKYSWPLNNMGLNCMGAIIHGLFSINAVVLYDPGLVESTEVELQMEGWLWDLSICGFWYRETAGTNPPWIPSNNCTINFSKLWDIL